MQVYGKMNFLFLGLLLNSTGEFLRCFIFFSEIVRSAATPNIDDFSFTIEQEMESFWLTCQSQNLWDFHAIV